MRAAVQDLLHSAAQGHHTIPLFLTVATACAQHLYGTVFLMMSSRLSLGSLLMRCSGGRSFSTPPCTHYSCLLASIIRSCSLFAQWWLSVWVPRLLSFGLQRCGTISHATELLCRRCLTHEAFVNLQAGRQADTRLLSCTYIRLCRSHILSVYGLRKPLLQMVELSGDHRRRGMVMLLVTWARCRLLTLALTKGYGIQELPQADELEELDRRIVGRHFFNFDHTQWRIDPRRVFHPTL